MELINESNFGQSAFQEKVNYHRAMEGELARTIRSLEPVEAARVHLSIPKKSLFKKNQKKPSASVKVTLKPGAELDSAQIAGMRNLIASGIVGLTPGSVTIVDQRGNLLARPRKDDGMVPETFVQLRRQREQALQDAILEVLRPVVENGNVRVTVSADMNFSRSETTLKQLDPEKRVVIGENRHEESSQSTDPKAGGVAGAAANVPGGAGPGKKVAGNLKTSKRETLQYETESSVRKTSTPAGRVERLSVAVVVDGIMIEGEDGENVWQKLSDADIGDIKALAANAAGIDLDRGDKITVVSRKFQVEAPPLVEPAVTLAPWVRDAMRWGVIALCVLALIFGVLRPFLKTVKPAEALAPQLALAGGAAGVGAVAAADVIAGALPEGTPTDTEAQEEEPEVISLGERLRLKAINSTQEDPKRAVEILRTWMWTED